MDIVFNQVRLRRQSRRRFFKFLMDSYKTGSLIVNPYFIML